MLTEARRDAIRAAMRAAARDQILPRFRQLAAGDISTKSGPADLVTLADTEAERQFIAAMATAWPEALALGEETVAACPEARDQMSTGAAVVVIDPVDGTWNYAKGLSVFGVLIAVLAEGRPEFGLLYDPLMDDWIEAAPGEGAHMVTPSGRRALKTSDETRPGRMNGYVTLGLFPKDLRARIVTEFPDFARITSLRCACHEYRMLAQGHVEFCLSGPVPHPWDHAAGALAVEEAGGVVRFLDGAPYQAGRMRGVLLAAASEEVWQATAARFAYLA